MLKETMLLDTLYLLHPSAGLNEDGRAGVIQGVIGTLTRTMSFKEALLHVKEQISFSNTDLTFRHVEITLPECWVEDWINAPVTEREA